MTTHAPYRNGSKQTADELSARDVSVFAGQNFTQLTKLLCGTLFKSTAEGGTRVGVRIRVEWLVDIQKECMHVQGLYGSHQRPNTPHPNYVTTLQRSA